MGVQLRRARRASHPRPLRSLPPRVCSPRVHPHSNRTPSPAPPPCPTPHLPAAPLLGPDALWPPARRPTPACPLPQHTPPHPDGAPRGGGIPTLRPLVAPHAPHPRVRPAYLGRSCSTSRIGRLLRAGGRLPPGSQPFGPLRHRPAVG